jgi:enolase-phosphatase E1
VVRNGRGSVRTTYDLADAGGKREADSYRRIAATIGAAPDSVLFLSDVGAELDAATLAGWQAVGVRRAGDPWGVTVGDYPTVGSLNGVWLRASGRQGTQVRKRFEGRVWACPERRRRTGRDEV